MRKSLVVVAVLGSTLISAAAFAASMNATGVIKAIDTTKNEITLADGKSYFLPAGFKINSLKAGEKVAVVYDLKNNKLMATAVTVAY